MIVSVSHNQFDLSMTLDFIKYLFRIVWYGIIDTIVWYMRQSDLKFNERYKLDLTWTWTFGETHSSCSNDSTWQGFVVI